MSFELPTKRTSAALHSRWSGTAFLVEAMLLLVIIMASLAVFTQLFAESAERANASRSLTDAVAAATATAELFCADPTGVKSEFMEGDLRVVCQVTPERRTGGVIYYATISVYGTESVDSDADGSASEAETAQAGVAVEPLYTVQTAKYESGA
ncbi:MAG: hypothetical protein IJI68_05850 [Eggerthellaceae bacterium]|nr:hypothetical protein [Eggerthellaceae bacterium]